MEVDARAVFSAAAGSWGFLPVPLFEGEEHRASLVVFLDDPDIVDEAPGAGSVDDEGSAALAAEIQATTAATEAIASAAPASLKLIRDVEMDVTVELGRTKMTVRNILSLLPGSVIELDRAAGAPVDLLVNGTLIGRGEVVVIDEEFGVRISEIIGRTED
jgi:flagellar motor switch protein FliN/FliY